MLRYTLLFIFCSTVITPIKAQIEQCDIIKLKDAIVIGEYLPCTPRDSVYVEGNHYICFDGKKVPFITYASFNKSLIKRLESNISIPECLKNIGGDPIVDYLDYKASLDWDFRREDITMKDGSPAIVFTHECTLHWMGKDFYQATVDTVYQRK